MDKWMGLEVISSIVDSLIVADKLGQIIFVNKDACDFLLYSDEELLKLTMKDICPDVFHDFANYTEWSQLLHMQPYLIVYKSNGTCYPATVKMAKLDSGCFVFNFTDASKNVAMAKELEALTLEMKEVMSHQNQFVANVTHELRTPVNGIRGHVDYLMSQPDITKQQQETLRIITRCCDGMEQIINDLLDFAKLDSGKFVIETIPFSLREMVNTVYQTNIKQATKKGLNLSFKVADSIPDELYGDPLRISQILNNLISNAIKFTSVGYVRVEIALASSKTNEIELFFLVIDSGIGIAQEDQKKLFKSFSQVDGSITRKYGGTGLGLAISKQLVEMMNGTIRVQSEKDKGTTFAFSLVLRTKPLNMELSVNDEMNEEIDSVASGLAKLSDELDNMLRQASGANDNQALVWGSDDNKKELKDAMEKIILCIEMENWEKAELFSDKIKTLTQKAGMDIIRQVFKFQMSIRKSDYDKCMEDYKILQKMTEDAANE